MKLPKAVVGIINVALHNAATPIFVIFLRILFPPLNILLQLQYIQVIGKIYKIIYHGHLLKNTKVGMIMIKIKVCQYGYSVNELIKYDVCEAPLNIERPMLNYEERRIDLSEIFLPYSVLKNYNYLDLCKLLVVFVLSTTRC